MSEPCRDCGGTHATGIDGLLCDYRIGGMDRVRERLRRFGVTEAGVESACRAVYDYAELEDQP